MAQIKYVTSQISADQVCEGFYTVEDGVLTMVYADGAPVTLEGFGVIQRKIEPDWSEKKVAQRLVRFIRDQLKGDKVQGFSNPINYPQAGVA